MEIMIRADEGNFVRYRTEDGYELPLDGDIPLPRKFVATFPDDKGAPELHLRIEMCDQVPRCREVLLAALPEGREVRPVDIRSVDIEKYLEIASAMIAVHMIEQLGAGAAAVHSDREPDLNAALKQVRWARRNTRRALPDSKLAEVAEVYRNNPKAPTAAVERHFGLKSRRTASLYVKRARDGGYLEERGADDGR